MRCVDNSNITRLWHTLRIPSACRSPVTRNNTFHGALRNNSERSRIRIGITH